MVKVTMVGGDYGDDGDSGGDRNRASLYIVQVDLELVIPYPYVLKT